MFKPLQSPNSFSKRVAVVWLSLSLFTYLGVNLNVDLEVELRAQKESEAEIRSPKLWPVDTLAGLREQLNKPEIIRPPELCRETPLLAIIGDTRAALNKIGPSALWFAQATQIKQDQPQALIHLGDWVKRGDDSDEWSAVLRSLNLLGEVPLITTRGNHDRGGLYAERGFDPSPSDPLKWSQVGPLLIITLDTEGDSRGARDAVEALLTISRSHAWSIFLKRRSVRMILWAQHRPLWSSGNHGGDERGWSSWLIPALEELGVQLMIAGHDHDYERFCESQGAGEARHCVQEDEQGVIYIVSGGGASVTVPFPGLAWRSNAIERRMNAQQRQIFSDAPHYLTLSMSCENLSRFKLRAWATPHAGVRRRLDELSIRAR